MSLGENLRSIPQTDSNIPIAMKNKFGSGRKLKARTTLPDLHKYIETIIASSNYQKVSNRKNLRKIEKGQKLKSKVRPRYIEANKFGDETSYEDLREKPAPSEQPKETKFQRCPKTSAEHEKINLKTSKLPGFVKSLTEKKKSTSSVSSRPQSSESQDEEKKVHSVQLSSCTEDSSQFPTVKEKQTKTKVKRKRRDTWARDPEIQSKIVVYKNLRHKSEELEDLCQIYKMMNKATESFLSISSKVNKIRERKREESIPSASDVSPVHTEKSLSDVSSGTESVKNLNEVEEEKSTDLVEDGEFLETTQKIDQVLKFMYDCILKFSSENIAKKGRILSQGELENVKKQSKIFSVESNTHSSTSTEKKKFEEPRTFSVTHIDETRKSTQRRKKMSVGERSSNITDENKIVPLETFNIPSGDLDTRCDSAELTTEADVVMTVEVQNELGGYTEGEETVVTETRYPKSVTPLSVKLKKTGIDTQLIKNALETEEKLLANTTASKRTVQSLIPYEPSVDIFIPKPQARAFTFFDMKPRTSNFFICVNSLPPCIRTCIRNQVTLPPSLCVSIHDTRPLEYKKVEYTKVSQHKEILPIEPIFRSSFYSYLIVEEQRVILNYSRVLYTSQTINSPKLFSKLTTVESNYEEYEIEVHIKPSCSKKSLFHEDVTEVSPQKEEDKVVEELEEEIKEVEETILLLENQRETSCKDKKIYDLLERTSNLQSRLQSFLHRSLEPVSISCPLVYQQTDYLTKGNTEVFPVEEKTSSMIYWYLQPPIQQTKVQQITESTSYHPPADEKTIDEVLEAQNLENMKLKKEKEIENDDNSSVYSFKSSKDCSETDIKNKPEEEKKFMKELFKEIELFKRTITKTEEQESRVLKFDRNNAKGLKTIFKGKESTTELSIGLMDFPLSKINNISIEKEKYSSNHTKISINITKEKSEGKLQKENINKNNISYYFDDVRPSVSTEYSRLGDNESMGDEDDYKSVNSSFSNTSLPENKVKEKKEIKELEKTKKNNTVCKYKELEPLQQALTEMQIRMRSIKRNSYFNSNEYYKRALKLAKMSAGYCKNCGNRAVIPEDSFGFYKSILPKKFSSQRKSCYVKSSNSPNSSFYSFCTSNGDLSEQFCDVSLKRSSSYVPRTNHSLIGGSFQDSPLFWGRI